jgi:hypothetical protein
MFIKKHSTKNEYVRAGDVWVRNFTKPKVPPLTLDLMFESEDYQTVLNNVYKNDNHPRISEERINFANIIIVSDGYRFTERHKCLLNFPKDIAVIAVNHALKKWSLMESGQPSESQRTVNAYVTNNPYKECLSCLPKRYFPTCIASTRTHHEFLERYQGSVYVYEPTPIRKFGLKRSASYYIDDYRNPVCAAIGLAHRFGVEKLMLMCCDDSFKEGRDFAVQLPNGLWTFPQHLRSQEIIDANLHWLTHQEERPVEVIDWSEGAEYANATYINSEGEGIDFFTGGQSEEGIQ